jgi:hypothetical protein
VDNRGIKVRFPAGERDFSLLHNFHAFSGVHQSSCSAGSGGCFPGNSRPGRETDNLPLSIRKLRLLGYVSTPA